MECHKGLLGPLLFLIYTNIVNSLTNNAKIRLFADDTNVLSTNSPTLKQLMTEVLKDLFQWFSANKLSPSG